MSRRDLDRWLWMVGAELQRLSEEITPSTPQVARRRGWEPRIDLVETEDALVVTAEIAGVRADDITISYRSNDHCLCVRGMRRPPNNGEAAALPHNLEIYFGPFERDIELPEAELDQSLMKASYRNGFLVVVIPKKTAETTRTVVRRSVTVRSL